MPLAILFSVFSTYVICGYSYSRSSVSDSDLLSAIRSTENLGDKGTARTSYTSWDVKSYYLI